MKFEKGHNKQGGRQKGTGNKDLEPIRKAFKDFVEGNLKQVQKDYDALETAKDRLYFILNIAEYCIPKLQRTELTGKDGKDFLITGFNYTPPQSKNGEESIQIPEAAKNDD